MLFNPKDCSLFLCVGEIPRSSLPREAKEVAKDTARGFICPRENSCESEFFSIEVLTNSFAGLPKAAKKNCFLHFLVALDASPLCMYNKLNRNSLVA